MDAVYMTATQAMTGQGGWPMTVFMTPDREPFFCGTYFPRDHFQRLVLGVAQAWRERRGEVTGQAREIAAALAERAAPLRGPGAGGPARQARWPRRPTRRSPRWPGTTTRRPAASAGRPSSRRRWCSSSCCGTRSGTAPAAGPALGMVTGTAEAMARGGMYDQLGGGFRPLLGGRRLGGAALREDALRQRAAGPGVRAPVAAHRVGAGPPGRRGDLRLAAPRARHARGRVRLGAGRGQRRRGRAVLHLDAGRAGRGARDRGR